MRNMIWFEWKKIFQRKFNTIAMIVGYVLMVVCLCFTIQDTSFYAESIGDYTSRVQAFEMARQRNETLTDYLTEEYVTEVVVQIQEMKMDLETNEAYTKVLRSNVDLLLLLAKHYMPVGEMVEWNRLNEISTLGGIGFYERRIEKIDEFLNMDFSYGNYTEEEKTYWMEKAAQVETPFQWGDKSSMDLLWMMIQIAFYLLFVIVICISPIFASEYESGAAALLLTTKYGKNRMICAKIFVAVIFSMVYLMVGIGGVAVMIMLSVGLHGAKLPVQLWGTIIPYEWSIGMTCVITFLVILLIALTVTCLTMLMSSRIKVSIITLVIDFVLLMGPAFLPMSKESRLWNQINYLFPVRAMNMQDVLQAFNCYQFGSVIVSYLGMIVLVYSIVAVISLLGIKNGFAKHQVQH